MDPRFTTLSRHVALLLASLAPVIAAANVRASDIHDLQRGLPLEVEDTTTTERGQAQVQGTARYEHEDSGDHMLFVRPQFQYGVLDNLHVEASYPFIIGAGDRTGAGDITLGALYRFLEEESPGFDDRPWPSMAVRADFVLPTGENSDGLDTTLSYIATKTLNDSISQDRLHLNLDWTHNMAADGSERENRFGIVFGYSRKLDEQTVVLADLVWEQQRVEGLDSTILEVGGLRQVSEKITVGVGLGVGLGDDSPEFRATVGVQYSF